MRALAPAILLAALAACVNDAPGTPSGPVNAQVVLAPGQQSEIANAGIRLRFVGVTGDSRCPGDVVCVTGGDALVNIDVISSTAGLASYVLHTGSMQPVRHNDLTIALVDLSPYPFNSRGPIAPGDYRATLRVTR